MKEHRFIADPLKCFAALFSCAVLLFLAWEGCRMGYILIAIICALLAAVFAYIVFLYGSVIHLSAEGVRKEFLMIPIKTYSWDQIREVGVVGTRIFNGNGKNKKPGRRYIYFSPEELDEESRFQMTLEWPPSRETLYCIYTKYHAEYVQHLWQKPIASYNAGDLFVMIDE